MKAKELIYTIFFILSIITIITYLWIKSPKTVIEV